MAPTIAIVGAGPAGLTLARLLEVSDTALDVTIFEKDASSTARHFQGGTLDLHPPTGIAALQAAGLYDEFMKHARYEGEEFVIADKNGTELIHMTEDTKASGVDARPEIDRETLKDMLLASVDARTVRWGKYLKFAEENGTLHFNDGTSAGPFDLVVGADGAWSKVRHLLTDVKPTYSGICGFECQIQNPNEKYPKLSKMVGRGSYFVSSDGKSMTAQRMGDESIKVGAWLTEAEQYPAKIIKETGASEASLKERILEHYQGWLPEIRQFVQAGTRFRPWPLYELPVGHTWDHKQGFTMIGDSAHLMTPFAGEGVNTAMKDALELSKAIVAFQKEGDNLDDAVERFEQHMFPRAKKMQEETMRNKIAMFREDAPVGLMVVFVGTMAEVTGYDLSKGYIAWIPVLAVSSWYFSTLTSFGSMRRRFWRLFYTEV